MVFIDRLVKKNRHLVIYFHVHGSNGKMVKKFNILGLESIAPTLKDFLCLLVANLLPSLTNFS